MPDTTPFSFFIYGHNAGERDAYMANSIRSVESDKIVAVVGLAHIDGIEKNMNSFGFHTLKRNCPQ